MTIAFQKNSNFLLITHYVWWVGVVVRPSLPESPTSKLQSYVASFSAPEKQTSDVYSGSSFCLVAEAQAPALSLELAASVNSVLRATFCHATVHSLAKDL